MAKKELEKETEEYLHNNYCCKCSCCGFNTECKEGVRIRCSEFEILEKHIINFAEPKEKRIAELENELKWERDTKAELAEHLGKANDKVADLEKHIEELKKQLDWKEKALAKAKKETKRVSDRVNKDKRRLIRRKADLEAQIEKMKSAVISERDEALRVEDIITYGVLNDVIDKWEIKNEQKEVN